MHHAGISWCNQSKEFTPRPTGNVIYAHAFLVWCIFPTSWRVTTVPSHWAVPEWPMQGNKGMTYAPLFSCRAEPQGSPQTRHQISERAKKKWEQKLREDFTDTLQVHIVQEKSRKTRNTIIMPLVKGKPRETKNVCRESLKNILEKKVRANTLNEHTSGWINGFRDAHRRKSPRILSIIPRTDKEGAMGNWCGDALNHFPKFHIGS